MATYQIQYRVVSDSEGWITEYDNRQDAEDRAKELNKENGLPSDHAVSRVVLE